MKKILHIITRLDRGGSTEHVLALAANLCGQGYEVTVLYGKTASPLEGCTADARAKGVIFTCIPHLVRDMRPLSDIRALAAVYRALRGIKPDIVHTHTSKAGIIGRYACFLYNLFSTVKVRTVHSTHGHVFYGYFSPSVSRLVRFFEKCTAPVTDTIVSLSDAEIDETLAFGIGKREQFTVIPSCIPAGLPSPENGVRERYGIPAGTLVIGSAGRFDPVKGYSFLIDAAGLVFGRFPGTPMVLLLAGDGDLRPALETRAARLGIADRVVFAGWRDDIADHIAAADIYVQPSLNEGFGKTVVLAQRLGKPVVATAVQGLKGLIADRSSGLLVPPGNAAAIADAVGELVRDPLLRARLGETARASVIRTDPLTGSAVYSADSLFRRYEKLYERLLS